MFKFNRDKLKIEFVELRALSKATIDPRVQFVDSNGLLHKMSIPVSIARIVRARLKGVNKFAKGYPACLAFVDGRIVAMDVATGPAYKMYKELDEWISFIETNVEVLNTIEGDWLWDGQYAYRTVGDIKQMGGSNFGSLETRVFNLYKLGEEKANLVETLACLCYKNPQTGDWVKTSPLAKHSGTFLQITGDVEKFNKVDHFVDTAEEFRKIDRDVFPNLRFVNYAAKVLANQFGYDVVEPLGLPSLMIEHQTFNIGGLPTEMQAQSPAPLSFTNALAWMIGLNAKVSNLDDLIAIKSSTKMLLTKGNTRQKIMGKGAKEESSKHLIHLLRKMSSEMPLVSYNHEAIDD